MSIDVSVVRDKTNETLSVVFRAQNEPVIIMGVEFPARPTTLGQTNWSDASVGRLPREVVEGLSPEDVDALKEQVIDVLMDYNKVNPPAPCVV